MSVLDHPIEFLPTSTQWSEDNNPGKPPTRRLKRLSLLNGKDNDRRRSESTEAGSSISSLSSVRRSSTLSTIATPRKYKPSTEYIPYRAHNRHSSSLDSYSSESSTPLQHTPPMTLFDQHAPLLANIAHKESVVNDLRYELDLHEKELRKLRMDWRRITAAANANSNRRNSKDNNSDDQQTLVQAPTAHNRTPSPLNANMQPRRMSHTENTPNAIIQQGVDMLVEGVGAFWDGFKNGPGQGPPRRA
ncbi:hypothetical protein WALSEDRAFT_31499 [Wallemia mellicola CBS 633.66]|uniref:Uncharacterized protein n=2 Tax=Wallemia mellicola TaxID=1708541 RepID=A0A4T0P1R7_9BASI|nr:hypothetical protein WALSEDRAFT_31499 [Wallemia mellicola CBS 633.66]TIB94301.1 hypothetical protein E3Q19_00568 [Wallemia mellicola]EIM23424.1 hypothetical protein WALSEDRAFT_31499 [Wallemia mellicola CBS 633.66]TIC03966.1 hypothetical protein E3Q17_00686 [Wallemia mellicola]TIC21108.1 hypothetical protein E3Q13_00254 [Wallemia mellicola]TIC32499.1 hypothetical protein E3Q10_01231 [Wallemia mellicola]|eukprot:XP_006956800.1 hypothetical protein WALSEDRAFT_31499 [Wallemia mellicola CBS 633.66]